MTSAKQKRLQAFDRNNYDLNGVHRDWQQQTPYTRYYKSTGAVHSTGHMSIAAIEREKELMPEFDFLLETSKPEIHFVKGGRKRVKSACPAVLQGLTLRNVPVPAKITIVEDATHMSTEYDCDESTVELEFNVPGDYIITVSSAPHTDGLYRVVFSDENQTQS